MQNENFGELEKTLKESIAGTFKLNGKLKSELQKEEKREKMLILYEKKIHWDLSTLFRDLKIANSKNVYLKQEIEFQQQMSNKIEHLSEIINKKRLFSKQKKQKAYTELHELLNKGFSLMDTCK